jgi:hypothetical protein
LENLAFFKTKVFARYYCIMVNAVLSLNLIFNLLGVLGNLAVQNIAGIFIVLGVGFLFGEILLILIRANKGNKIGWILVRFSYVTMFMAILGMLSIMGGMVISSFYLVGGNSPQAAVLFSTLGITISTGFGICLSAICYHVLPVEDVWNS